MIKREQYHKYIILFRREWIVIELYNGQLELFILRYVIIHIHFSFFFTFSFFFVYFRLLGEYEYSYI